MQEIFQEREEENKFEIDFELNSSYFEDRQ